MGQGHFSSFILRLWVEPPDGVRWGVIQHVATQEKLRFRTEGDGSIAVEDLIDFIRRHSDEGETSLPFILEGQPPASVDGKSQDGTGPSIAEPQDEAGIAENQA